MKRSLSGKESWTVSAVVKKKPKDVSDSAANGNLKPAKLKPGPLSWKSKKLDQLARTDFADIDDLLMTDSEDDEEEEEIETKVENEEDEEEGESEDEDDCYSDMETSDLGTSNIFEIEMRHDEKKEVVKFIVDFIVDKACKASDKTGEETVGKKSTPQRAECDICGQTISLARLTVHKRLPHQFACTKAACHKKFTIAKALARHLRASHDENDESAEESNESEPQARSETPSVPLEDSAMSPDPSEPGFPKADSYTPEPDSSTSVSPQTVSTDLVTPEPDSAASPTNNSSSRTASRISSVDSTESSKFTCKLCGEQFNAESRLSYHYYSPHPFQCTYCEFSFNTKITMENHVSLLHNQAGIIDNASCHFCGETFKRSSTLERHTSAPHPFPCKFCENRFQMKKQLTKHNSTFHKGQKLPKAPKKERKKRVNRKKGAGNENGLQEDDEEIKTDKIGMKRKVDEKQNDENGLEEDYDEEIKINKKGKKQKVIEEEDSSDEDDDEEIKKDKKSRKTNTIVEEEHSDEDDEEISPSKRGRKRKIIADVETSEDDEDEETETPRRRKRIIGEEEEASEEDGEIQNGNDNCDEKLLDLSTERTETSDKGEDTELEKHPGGKKKKRKTEDLTVELTCDMCDLIIIGRKKFGLHEKKVHKFPCDVEGCEKKFIFKGKLGLHKKSAHTEPTDTYECEQCGVKVCDVKTKPEIAKSKMDRHNALPHVHDCQSCELKFVSEERRDYHSSKIHDTEFSSELECRMCRKSFDSEKLGKNNALVIRNFLVHLESPHDFSCEECKHTFTTKQFLKKHEKDEHAESLAKQQCSMCGIEILKDEKENAKMKLKSHESQSHPYDCEECDLHFIIDLRLKHHENLMHGKENKIELSCALCGKEFDAIEQLFDHAQLSHDYPCKFCEKEFTKKGLLTFHTNSNHKKDDEEDVYSCDLCDEEFLRKEQLDAHVELAHKEPLICPMCKEDFGEDTECYEEHIKINHSFACDECDVSYTVHGVLKQHKRNEHPKVCNLCEKDFEDSLDEFEEHKTFKHEFDCNRCDLKFVTKSLQEAHAFDVHGVEDEEDTQCGICQLNFKVSKFRDHMRAPHRWGCDHCRLKFSEKDSLDEHVRDVHDIFSGKNKAYACKFCGVEYKDKEKYKEHKSIKHNYDCNKCELKFTTNQKLQEHSLEEHGKKVKHLKKKLTCNMCGMVCDKKFDMPSCKDYYLKHVATPHKFSCKRCDLKFTVKGKLDKHMIEHTGETSGFECKLCGYYFSHKKLFDDHETKSHRYKCRDANCENMFISEDQLEKHCSKKHQETVQPVIQVREFNCNLCGRVFKSDYRLESHLSINHEFGCNYCSRRYTVDVALTEHVKTVHKIEDRREREKKGKREVKPKSNKNAFTCNKCRQEKRTIQDYRQHIQMPHSYNCNYCPFKFTMKSYLDVHMECTHMEAVVMGMLVGANSETTNQQDVAAANRRLARQCDNALTWLRSKLVKDHLHKVMAGKGHSARHRMFMNSSIREECCRTDQSKLFKLSNQPFLSLPPSTDAAALSIIEQIYMSGPPVLNDVPRNKFMFEYITCVLLPDAWLFFLIRTKGLNQSEAEAAFFKGGSEIEQQKLFDLDVRGWLEKEEIKNWTRNSVPQNYKPRDERQSHHRLETTSTKPDKERRNSMSGEGRITPCQQAGKLTLNRPQFTPERVSEKMDSWDGNTTPSNSDIRSPFEVRSTPVNLIRERVDSSSGNDRIMHKLADPRVRSQREDPRKLSASDSRVGHRIETREEAHIHKDAAVPNQTPPSYGLSQESLAWLGLSKDKRSNSDFGKFAMPESPNLDSKSSHNIARDQSRDHSSANRDRHNLTRDPRSNAHKDPKRTESITQERKGDFGNAFRDPRSPAKLDINSDLGSGFRDTRRPESVNQEKTSDLGAFRDPRRSESLHQEKMSDFGNAFRDGGVAQQRKGDFVSTFRDSRKSGVTNQDKKADFGGAFKDLRRPESLNHEKKSDFSGASRDPRRSESLNVEKRSDFGGAFRDPRRSESLSQEKKSDIGGASRDPRSQAKPEKSADFGSGFKEVRSEKHADSSSRDPRRLIKPSEGNNDTRDPRKKESKSFHENYY